MPCSVAKCRSDYGENIFVGRVTLYRFPDDSNLQKIWINLCNIREDKFNPKFARVCSKHFSEVSYPAYQRGRLRRDLLPEAVPSLNLPNNPTSKPELTSIKIEPINKIKNETEQDNYYNEQQSQDDVEVKSDINDLDLKCKNDSGTNCECITSIYKPEGTDYICENEIKLDLNDQDDIEIKSEINDLDLKCKKDSGTKCDCITCTFKPKGTDYISENQSKLDENYHKNLLINDDASSVSYSECNDDDEQKIDISEACIEFIGVPPFKIEEPCETMTGQMAQLKDLKISLVDHKYDVKLSISDKHFIKHGDLTTNSAIRASDRNSETAAKSTNSKSHMFPSCQKSFVGRKRFFTHILRNHGDDEKLKKVIMGKTHSCPKCNKQFIGKCNLDGHVINRYKHEPNVMEFITSKIFRCPKCNKLFMSKLDLDSHIKTNHNKDKSLLKPIFSKQYNLLKRISSKQYNCLKCNKQYLSRPVLENHILSCHSDDKDLLKTISRETLDCPKCEKQFYSKVHLDAHIVRLHKDDASSLKMVSSKKHTCPTCNEHFIHKIGLECHILHNHKDDKDLMKLTKTMFYCPICGKKFLRKSVFESHLVHKHSADQTIPEMVSCKTFDCPTCKKQFVLKR